MRELKVRAWHKPYKQMCNVSMLQFDYDGTICAAVIIEKPFNDQRLAKIDDLIIEQDTGLKDRNGTKINEGDVFKPDFENGKGGWIVFYDHECKTLAIFKIGCYDSGEPVHYATREDAEKSIKENERDWKTYFEIEEWE